MPDKKKFNDVSVTERATIQSTDRYVIFNPSDGEVFYKEHSSLMTVIGAAISIGASQVTAGTFADARISESSVTQHEAALSIAASQVTSGTFADARISESSVTQHEAAFSIAYSQVTSVPLSTDDTMASAADNMWYSGLATKTYINTQIAALVASSPATLDTLDELAAALGDDPNFATTVSTALGNRVRVDTASQGLNSTQMSNARTNIGAGDVTAASAFGTNNSVILADGTGKGVKSSGSNLTVNGGNITTTGTYVGNGSIRVTNSSEIRSWDNATPTQRRIEIIAQGSPVVGGQGPSLTSTHQENDQRLVIQSLVSSASGSQAAISLISTRSGDFLSSKPTLSGYNYTTKQWEVGANGTWDYQGNTQSNVGLLDMAGNIDLNTNDIIAGGDIAAATASASTSLTSPLIIGGSSTTQDLTFQTTTGVGETGADMHFLVGNNGATEAMTILNNGNVGIGTSSPQAPLHIQKTTAGGETVGLILKNPSLDTNTRNTIRLVSSTSDAGLNGVSDIYNIRQSDGSSDIRFASAPGSSGALADLVTIDGSTGNVGIGTTSPGARLHVIGNINTTGSRITNAYFTDHTTTNAETIDSDARLKKDVHSLKSEIGRLMKIRPVTYRWKDQARGTDLHYGVIAQEIEKIYPEVVRQSGEHLTVAYTELIMPLIRAVQELKEEFTKHIKS